MKKYYFLIFTFICASCANIIMPSGGEKDISPPVLVKLAKSYDEKTKKLIKLF